MPQTTLNYKEELSKLEEGKEKKEGEYEKELFSPADGKHVIAFGREPSLGFYFKDKGKPTEQKVEAIYCDILVSNKAGADRPYLWIIQKGKTKLSLYGKVLRFAAMKGKLAGETMTLLVESQVDKQGQRKRVYTVPEVVE